MQSQTAHQVNAFSVELISFERAHARKIPITVSHNFERSNFALQWKRSKVSGPTSLIFIELLVVLQPALIW